MTTSTHRVEERDTIVLGVILVALGGGALALQILPDSGSFILLAIGLGLVAVFALTRHYATLVPGSIMTGLGAGILGGDLPGLADSQSGGLIVGGLGLGFLAIWVIGSVARIPEHHPWPLVPGAILTTIGLALTIGGFATELIAYWPFALIAVGFIVLVRVMAAGPGRDTRTG